MPCGGPFRDDGVAQRAPRGERIRPVVEAPIGQGDEPASGSWIDPQHRTSGAEVAERRRRVGSAGPVRRLLATNLDAQSPRAWVEPPHPGNDTGQVGELDRDRFAQHLVPTAVAAAAARRAVGSDRPPDHRARLPASRPGGSTSCRAGSRTASATYVANGRPVRSLDGGRGEFDPGVGVDPSAARLGDRLGTVRRVPTGVGEKVTKRAPGLADGLVEADGSLLDSDHRRPTGHDLGERRQSELTIEFAERRRRTAVSTDDGGGRVGDLPVGDELQRPHRSGRQALRPVISSASRNARSRLWRALSRGSQTVS